MDRNNIRAAVQIEDFDSCRDAWKISRFNNGSTDFFTFITTPGVERDAFIKQRERDYRFSGLVMITVIKG